jgi:DNA polymerase I-like protein with 3'-5' exonuclease and polymerase domains
MHLHTTSAAALRFWLETAKTLSRIEGRGVRVDVGYIRDTISRLDREAKDSIRQISSLPEFRLWRRRYGEKTNPNSYAQLAEVVFGVMGHTPRAYTAGSYDTEGNLRANARGSAGEAAFEGLDVPIAKLFVAAARLRKIGDFLKGILREAVQHGDGDWYVHPSYNLNTVISFRSSCSDPNYQNQPKRNKAMAEAVRRAYIPRRGRHIGEADYGQIEVKMACPYTLDPVLMGYVNDPTSDMHYDMTTQIFKLPRDKITKQLRNIVKGAYVFATFYGSFYGLTAPNIWEDVDLEQPKIKDSETTIREHLTQIGFTELGDPENPQPGTWCDHLKKIDEDFWGRRFRQYAEWKREWYDDYIQTGGISLLTGFGLHAPGLDKKQICNIPIQGSAFHCLAWSLNRLEEKFRRYKLESVCIGEIHDSGGFDIVPSERDTVFELCETVMAQEIREFAPWLNVPLTVECELAAIDRPWFDIVAMMKENSSYRPVDLVGWEKKFGSSWSNQNA